MVLLLVLSTCIGQPPPPEGSQGVRAGELVSSWTGTEPGRPGSGLYLRNNTSRAVRVLSVTLEGCSGIREECRRYEIQDHLGPGEVRRVMSVHPEVAGRSFEVRWSFDREYVEGGGADAR